MRYIFVDFANRRGYSLLILRKTIKKKDMGTRLLIERCTAALTCSNSQKNV